MNAKNPVTKSQGFFFAYGKTQRAKNITDFRIGKEKMGDPHAFADADFFQQGG